MRRGVTQADVRRIALSLPEVEESMDGFGFSVLNKGKSKGIAWVWLERLEPRKARVPNPDVLAVRVANLSQKDLILSSDSKKFFTEPHYNGYPAVMVRLAAVTVPELEMLLADAWRCQAPKELTKGLTDDEVPRRAKPIATTKAKVPAKAPARAPARARTKKSGAKAAKRKVD